MTSLVGTGVLLRFNLRRDRVMIPVWVAVNTLMVLSMPNTLKGLYGTAAERADLLRQVATNSSFRALIGPVFDDSLGALTAWRVGVFAGALAAVTALLVVVRHTRDEEESGRQELISSGVVGRRASLTAALLAAAVASGVLALLVTAGLAGQGAEGALAFGLGLGAVGMLFATTAAIVAQLTESARLTRGLTAGVLGAAFVLRAAGDSASTDGSSVLTWLSPLGWLSQLRPFAGERWWVLLLFAAAVAAQGALAYVLAGRRDVGMSFVPTRPGPASGRLGTAGALAWRLQRGGVLGWSIGFFLAGVIYGGLTDGVADLVGDNAKAREIFERMGGQSGLTDAFLASMTGMLGLVATLFVVASVLRLHGEETSMRAEPLLANAVGPTAVGLRPPGRRLRRLGTRHAARRTRLRRRLRQAGRARPGRVPGPGPGGVGGRGAHGPAVRAHPAPGPAGLGGRRGGAADRLGRSGAGRAADGAGPLPLRPPAEAAGCPDGVGAGAGPDRPGGGPRHRGAGGPSAARPDDVNRRGA
ncbi:ABC-2 type transport system permease protein [Streptomyces sp. SAI-041]|nr:ABC-2 type transport system permease protein [Streptomyces sp. SAI-041]